MTPFRAFLIVYLTILVMGALTGCSILNPTVKVVDRPVLVFPDVDPALLAAPELPDRPSFIPISQMTITAEMVGMVLPIAQDPGAVVALDAGGVVALKLFATDLYLWGKAPRVFLEAVEAAKPNVQPDEQPKPAP